MELPSSCFFGDLRWVLDHLVYSLKLFERSSIQVHGVCLIIKNLVFGVCSFHGEDEHRILFLVFPDQSLLHWFFSILLPSLEKTFLPSVTRRTRLSIQTNNVVSKKKCILHEIINDGGYIARFWTRGSNVQNMLRLGGKV